MIGDSWGQPGYLHLMTETSHILPPPWPELSSLSVCVYVCVCVCITIASLLLEIGKANLLIPNK